MRVWSSVIGWDLWNSFAICIFFDMWISMLMSLKQLWPLPSTSVPSPSLPPPPSPFLCCASLPLFLPSSFPSFLPPSFLPSYVLPYLTLPHCLLPSLYRSLPTVDIVSGFAHAAGFAAAQRCLQFLICLLTTDVQPTAQCRQIQWLIHSACCYVACVINICFCIYSVTEWIWLNVVLKIQIQSIKYKWMLCLSRQHNDDWDIEHAACSHCLSNAVHRPSSLFSLARLQTWRAIIFSRVCLSVCVSDRHFYPSTLTNFHETWSQGPYCDLVWPRP